MTAIALRLLAVPRNRQCAECPTLIPDDGRTHCYFHDRPPELRSNRPLHERRLEHVRDHLREQDREFLPWLIEPLTVDEIATATQRTSASVRHSWSVIRQSLALDTGQGQTEAIARIALLRVIGGLSRCFCERE